MKRHKLATTLIIATLILGLSGCTGAKQTLDDPKAAYQKEKSQLPKMQKKFSAPNLGVLLNGFKIKGVVPRNLGTEATATARLAEQQGIDLIKAANFDPAKCRNVLLNTYQDNENIPASYAQANFNSHASVIRVQLRSYPTVAAVQAAIAAQHDLAQQCPAYTVTAPGSAPTKQSVSAADYPLDGATDGTMMTYNSTVEGRTTTEVGIFERVGNLELRVYFDGSDPKSDAAVAKGELQAFITELGQALIAKQG